MELRKFEYLDNEKSFLDEIKSIFYTFESAIIWCKNKIDEKQWTQALTVCSDFSIDLGRNFFSECIFL